MIKLFLSWISIFILGSRIFAGSVSSGGGKFIGTESNPWFLENVQSVRYCLDVDQKAFRPSLDQIRDSVKFSLDKWMDVFSNRLIKDNYYRPNEVLPFQDIRLATQKFIEVPCESSSDIDLRFQFGGLTREQEKLLPNFKDYIGIAVRTDYDLETLKGKGFIYIAADSGLNRPTDSDFSEDPWTVDNFGVLKAVIIHELGHVFGLRHESGKSSIMSDALIDMLVHRDYVSALRNRPGTIGPLLLNSLNILNYDPNMVITECSAFSVKALSNLLHLDNGTNCVKLAFSHNDPNFNKLRIRVLSAPSKNGPFFEEGSILSHEGFNGTAKPIIEIKVSSDQKVFSKLPTDMWGNRVWAGYQKVTQRKFTGTYTNDAGQKTENLFGFIGEAGQFQLGGFQDGKIRLQIYGN